jgi:hypothetical protein
MVTVYFAGGLGNQLFQVAATYNLAKKFGDEPVFNFNTSHTPLQGNEIIKYKNNVFKEFKHSENIIIDNIFSQSGHSFEEIPYKKNVQLQGFFQSEKFFTENKNEIVEKIINGLKTEDKKYKEIVLWLKKVKEENNNLPLVSIHVRRGDYLKFPNIHTICSLDYYKNSLNLIKEKIGHFTPIIISDDKLWCKNNLIGIISPFFDEIEDLILMSNCDHNIIANSSFSWWGAYLNQNKNKVVIGPKLWFGLGGPQDQEDTIPKQWIKI